MSILSDILLKKNKIPTTARSKRRRRIIIDAPFELKAAGWMSIAEFINKKLGLYFTEDPDLYRKYAATIRGTRKTSLVKKIINFESVRLCHGWVVREKRL